MDGAGNPGSSGGADLSSGGSIPVGGPTNTDDAAFVLQTQTDIWSVGIDSSDTPDGERPFKIARGGDISTDEKFELAETGQLTLPFYTSVGQHLTVSAGGVITSEDPPAASPLQVTQTAENTTDNLLVRSDGTSGRVIQTSDVGVSDTGGLTGVSSVDNSGGGLVLGGSATLIDLGATGIGTTVKGSLTAQGGLEVTGNISSTTLETSGAITAGAEILGSRLDTEIAEELSLGDVNATSVSIGRTGVTTTVDGDLEVKQGLDVTSNIVVSGTVDGRDVATDGTNQDTHIADTTVHWTPQAGTNNVSYGSLALEDMSTGENNIGVGSDSMKDVTTGSRNVAIGPSTADKTLVMDDSVLIGFESGQSSWGNAINNTFIGSGAAKGTATNLTGHDMVAVGYRSQNVIRAGNYNTSVGADSLRLAFNGTGNVAVGFQAGDGITSTSFNTCIGHQSDAGGFTNSIALGRGSVPEGSNTCGIGNNALTSVSPHTGATCSLGTATAKWENVFANGNVTADGNITAGGNMSATGWLAGDGMSSLSGRYDRNNAGTVAIGETTATSVSSARTGITTFVKGPLEAEEGLDVTGKITGSRFLTPDADDATLYTNGLVHTSTAGMYQGLRIEQTNSVAEGIAEGFTTYTYGPEASLSLRCCYNELNMTHGGTDLAAKVELDRSRLILRSTSTTTTPSVHGVYVDVIKDSGTNTVTELSQFRAATSGSLVGTIGTMYGFRCDDLFGSTRYAFYQSGTTDRNAFLGNLGVGEVNTGTAGTLTTSGDITCSGDLICDGGLVAAKSYTVATLPAQYAGGMIYVSDETGGATMAFSDGTNWRRMSDRAVVA